MTCRNLHGDELNGCAADVHLKDVVDFRKD